MNRVEQAVCRIREKLPNNQGFVTLGVGCVVKNEDLASSLGWRCPNLIATSATVISPEHLALDRIFLAEFLVFEKKGFEVFDLKLASEFCRTVSSRAVNDNEVTQLPNDQVTVICVEPLDKRGFLKRMVKKSSLQTTRPIECFNFQSFENELTTEGIFCNVIREFGSFGQDFETRTYKFKYNPENRLYFLEDFGQQRVELDIRSFPEDQNPRGGVIFTKLGAYVGCLGYYGTGRIVPSFIPNPYLQGAESQEENPAAEEKKEKLLVEGAVHLDKNREGNLLTDENSNKESHIASVSVEKDEEEIVKLEKEEIHLEENNEVSKEDNIQDESSGTPGVELQVDQEVQSKQITEDKKGLNNKEDLKTGEVFEGETLVEEGSTEPDLLEKAEGNDLSKLEESSGLEFVISVGRSEEESQDDMENVMSDSVEKQEVDDHNGELKEENTSEEDNGELIHRDTEASTLVNKDDEAEPDKVEERQSSPVIDNDNGSNEGKDVLETINVSMETRENNEERPGEESIENEEKLQPSMDLHLETEVKNSNDKELQPEHNLEEKEVRGTCDVLEIGTESSVIENDADLKSDKVSSDNQGVQVDEGKDNPDENISTMEEDQNVLIGEEHKKLHIITSDGNAEATLEEQLDKQLSVKTKELSSEKIQHEEETEEITEDKIQGHETLQTDLTNSFEQPEKDVNLTEVDDVSESGKTEEALETVDKPDGSVTQEGVLKLEPTQPPKKADEEMGDSLEPDALLSSTITNNPKILEDLSQLLDTEYQHGGIASWHDMALLLDIPKEAFDHCLSYSKSSPTESLMVFLSNTKPQFTISDLKDSLRSIGRTDVVHLLDRYIARSIVSNESVIVGIVERDDTDLLGELALRLDIANLQNWKSLAVQLEVPRRIFKHFGSQQRQNPALIMLKYLPIFDPDLTVQSLKDASEAISKFDVVKFLDSSGVPGEDAIMDILEDTDIIDEVTDMLNDDGVGPNWKDLAKELKIPEEKFSIFEPSAKYSPTKMLLQSIEQCEPDITVEELILALVAMKRHDVIDMLYKHFKKSDIRSILEENNCLPPEPEGTKDEVIEDDEESSFA